MTDSTMRRIDIILSTIQLYSYLLPTVKIGNWIMDFREKYVISRFQERRVNDNGKN